MFVADVRGEESGHKKPIAGESATFVATTPETALARWMRAGSLCSCLINAALTPLMAA